VCISFEIYSYRIIKINFYLLCLNLWCPYSRLVASTRLIATLHFLFNFFSFGNRWPPKLLQPWTRHCGNKNHSYKHNEQINNQNIDNSECFGVKFVKIYPEMTSQYFFEKIWFYVAILLATYCISYVPDDC
jgi:hypothetical protein